MDEILKKQFIEDYAKNREAANMRDSLGKLFDKYFSMNEWIKTEERLPEIGHHVLVRTAYLNQKKEEINEIFVAYRNDEDELVNIPDDWTGGDDFEECVTHWMPLPDPPHRRI